MTRLRASMLPVALFGEEELESYLARQSQRWQAHIHEAKSDYLLGVNEAEYVAHVVSEFSLDNIELDFDGVTASAAERQVHAEEYPSNFAVRRGEVCTRNVYIYHVPFSGDPGLLRMEPSRFSTWHVRGRVENGEIHLEVGKFAENPSEIQKEADEQLRLLRQYYGYVRGDIQAFNDALPLQVRRYVESRKSTFQHRYNMLAELNVPVKKQAAVAETISIPTSRRPARIVLPRPAVHEAGFKPEPTLDQSVYRNVLDIIYGAGQSLERLPSTYDGKGEEDLRDHLIILLEPHFQLEGSVTGETFNKAGKTDILIKYQNQNAFAAECKFWRGATSYLRTIDQLLSYLTWRDSKAAVISFHQNQGFSADLETIREQTPNHPNFVDFVGQPADSWFDFRFHLPGDRNRLVELAVLAFHFPKTKA